MVVCTVTLWFGTLNYHNSGKKMYFQTIIIISDIIVLQISRSREKFQKRGCGKLLLLPPPPKFIRHWGLGRVHGKIGV